MFENILLPYSVIRIDTLLCYSGLLCWAHLQMCHPTPLYGPILLVILRNVPPYSVISHSAVNWNFRVLNNQILLKFICFRQLTKFGFFFKPLATWLKIFWPSTILDKGLVFSIAWCYQPHWMGHRQHPNLKMDMDGWVRRKKQNNPSEKRKMMK